MKLTGLLVLIAMLGLGGPLGCGLFGGDPDEKSGDDAKRGGAEEIKLDAPHDGRVSPDQGDATDWKKFELVQRTRIVIKIWWDNPDVEGSVVLRGTGGGASKTLKHKRGGRMDTLGPLDLDEGQWFIQVQSTSGASVYTMEVTSGMAKAKPGGSDLPDF